jgi:hypothetical protein
MRRRSAQLKSLPDPIFPPSAGACTRMIYAPHKMRNRVEAPRPFPAEKVPEPAPINSSPASAAPHIARELASSSDRPDGCLARSSRDAPGAGL